MKKMHRFLKINCIMMALVLVFALTGCGAEPSLLRYDLSGGVTSLDPQFADGESEQLVIYNMMEGLMRQLPSGELENGVITEYEVSEDQTVYTFSLKEGMVWDDSENTPVTAHDFVFAFQRIFNNIYPSPFASMYSSIHNSQKVLSGQASAEELGVKATFQPIDWDAKEMELSSGNIDCIWNGMSITPEREEAMSLSQAYLNNKIVIMTKEGVTVSAKEDLANYNIGIQAGSAALEAVTNDAVYASIQDKITEYPTYDEVILDVQAGRLDCMIIDEVYGGYKNAKLGSIFAVSEVDFGDDLYAIGFRKGDAELTQAVNDAINALIESGKAAEISEAWFGADIVVKG